MAQNIKTLIDFETGNRIIQLTITPEMVDDARSVTHINAKQEVTNMLLEQVAMQIDKILTLPYQPKELVQEKYPDSMCNEDIEREIFAKATEQKGIDAADEMVKILRGELLNLTHPATNTSDVWEKKFQEICPGFRVLDPDGWDRTNYKYSWYQENITKQEWIKRMCNSTCQFGAGFHEAMSKWEKE